MELLKFIICGNVDDGKSTLTGRLLYDTNNIFEDQYADHTNKSTGAIDLARVTDGLRSEREQGITIDVAYKYFSTPRRKFICIDAPGHKEYTRNMVSGASQADVAILLIDAKHGITEQTIRHARVCRFLQLKHIIIAINKMDAAGYLEEIFHSITAAFEEQAGLGANMQFIPVSGLTGDNVTKPCASLSWYKGPTLLGLLETIDVSAPGTRTGKFIVQQVIRQEKAQYLYGYSSGTILQEQVVHLASGATLNMTVESSSGNSYCLKCDIGAPVERGDALVQGRSVVQRKTGLGVELFNLGSEPLKPGAGYLFLAQSSLQTITFQAEKAIAPNDFGSAMLDLEKPLFLTSHESIKGILIDPHSKKTIAAVHSLYSSK